MLANARICWVCRTPIVAEGGNYWVGFGILVHNQGCQERVKAALKDYSRSSRGHKLPVKHVLEATRGQP